MNFEKHAAKGNEFVNLLAAHLGDPDNRERAGRVLRCVLHALRNRLPIEESMQLISQLPMAIKAIYVDGWKPGHTFARIRTMSEFAEEVMRIDGAVAWRDFSGLLEAVDAVQAVMRTVAHYVSSGELDHVVAILPEDMKSYFYDWTHQS
jgi:uncharacterized protein (DUF2267 family)